MIMATTSSKRILVTGGAGFLGSHLCEKLLAAGHEVTCLDNFYSGSKANLAHLMHDPKFTLVEMDVAEPSFFEVDVIYNMACPASPVHYKRFPIETMKTSVLGAINMLEIARKRPGTIMIQASTSEVYGDPLQHPQREDYFGNVNTLGPRACYDEGKRAAETLCMDYHRQYGVSVKIPRIFNTYGPNMVPDDGRAVSNFIVQALRGEDITIHGDGSQTRSFCYYADTVTAFVKLMDTPADFTGPVNIGNPHEITVGELADRVIAMTRSTSKRITVPLTQDDPTRRCPDIARAKAVLQWEPTVTLEQGLESTIDYFRKLLKA